MRGVGSIEAIRSAGKNIGKGIGRLFEKVNPDVWRELGYVTASSYSLMLPRREQVVDRGADGFLPIVLVHGLGGNRGLWWPLRLFLRMKSCIIRMVANIKSLSIRLRKKQCTAFQSNIYTVSFFGKMGSRLSISRQEE